MLKRITGFLAISGMLLVTLTAGWILFAGFHDTARPADVAIVLGSMVDAADGSLSPRLAARVAEGMALYQKGLVKAVIVSGGFGNGGHDEAKAMKAWMVARGIPEQAIIPDNQGFNTAATACNSAQIMRSRGFHSAIIVSQYFHIARTRMAMKRCNIQPLYSAHAPFFESRDFYSMAREITAFWYYWLFHRHCDKPEMPKK